MLLSTVEFNISYSNNFLSSIAIAAKTTSFITALDAANTSLSALEQADLNLYYWSP